MVSLANLERLLVERGFTIEVEQHGEAHQPNDLSFAAYLAVNRLAPHGDAPWWPEPTVGQKIGRGSVYLVGAPILAFAFLIDNLLAPLARGNWSNTYRIVARKPS
jgi:hypothetical protein